MDQRMTVTWRGRTYEAVREPGPVWRLTEGGAPVTTLPAERGEGEREVRDRVIQWLEGNASRPPGDVGRQ